MPDLTGYLLSDFDQTEILRSEFGFKKDVQGGVCAALCNVFFLLFFEGKVPANLRDVTAAVKKEFDIAINRQRVWKDAWAQTKGDRITIWNSVSSVTRLHFMLADQGSFVEPFKKQLPLLPRGFYVISVTWTNNGMHLLAMIKIPASVLIFDPNWGLFEVANNKIDEFSTLLFAEYKKYGWDLDDWLIASVSQAQSARERMIQALNKLT